MADALTTNDQSIAEAMAAPKAPEALLYFTLRSRASTVKVSGKPTTDIESALAAMPVQRRVSLAAVLLAKATLSLAEVAKKPVASAVTRFAVSPENAAPRPTNKFTPLRSIVSTSSDTDPFEPSVTFDWLLLPNVNRPAVRTYPPRFSRTKALTVRVESEVKVRIGLVPVAITEDQLMAEALLPPEAPEAPEAVLYFTLRSFTSTVNSGGKPTTDIDAALAAIPVQRRVSLATVLLAIATLKVAEVVKKPVATVTSARPVPVLVTISPVSPLKLAPTPTNKFTPVRSIVSKSADTVSTVAVLRFNVNAPAANT